MLKKILLWNLLLLALLLAFKTHAIAEDKLTMPPISIPDKIDYYADKYHVKSEVMHKIIKCESGYNPKARNSTKRENSWGMVQINLNAHKDISIEQATDPDFSIDFLAQNLADNNGKIWTCFRK